MSIAVVRGRPSGRLASGFSSSIVQERMHMTTESEKAEHLPTAQWERHDKIISRFEEDWLAGRRAVIDDYLPTGADRLPVLIELIHTELELRLKKGQGAWVEQYLLEYPEIGPNRDVVMELLAAEYRHRRQREAGVEFGEYSKRFPQFAGQWPKQLDASGSGRAIPETDLPGETPANQTTIPFVCPKCGKAL